MVPNPSLKNYPYNETSCESLLPICDWSKLFHWETHLPLTHMILVLIDRILLNEHTELCALTLRFLMCKHHWLTKIYGYQNVFDDLDFLNVTEEVSYIPGYTALNSFLFFFPPNSSDIFFPPDHASSFVHLRIFDCTSMVSLAIHYNTSLRPAKIALRT